MVANVLCICPRYIYFFITVCFNLECKHMKIKEYYPVDYWN